MAKEKTSTSYRLSVISACYGFSFADIAERVGLTAATLRKCSKGHEPRKRSADKIEQMYSDAPLREIVEELRLYDKEFLFLSLLALKRQKQLTNEQLGKIIGVDGSTISVWITGKHSPRHKIVPIIAKTYADNKLTKENIEEEKTAEKRFVMTGKHRKPNKQIIFMKDRNGDVRDVLHRVKEDTGIFLKDIPQETGIKQRVWWHYTRPNGKIPSSNKQQRLFMFFRKLYEDKGLEFPFYIRKNNIA